MDPSFVGVRGSSLLSDLFRLAAEYPPALVAIKVRRERLEGRVVAAALAGAERGEIDARLLVRINEHLGDSERSVRTYSRIASRASKSSPVRQDLLVELLPLLARRRRYAYIADEWAVVEPRLASDLETLVTVRAFSSQRQTGTSDPKSDGRELAAGMLQLIRERVALFVEALLGAEDRPRAREVRDRLLSVDAGGMTYAALLKCALRAEDAEMAAEIRNSATQRLQGDERSLFDVAAGE